MFIKEVVLDGFKSYATRTRISGFDEKFNAITGLNGSGKSNILDSICFVLGITQLSQVRVANLQGLVYKNGQAGVTKASVSILFDNLDKEQTPVGYEKVDEITVTRIIVIGGKNKYLINGKTAQSKQVQELFHSVQLNVNNPHFLIMQGRITKVLNMKPHEILGMVEEAAGTRMYESKKLDAQKKMVQKEVKVEEIEKILKNEITPKLEKLRDEKRDYLKYSSAKEEMERTERFCVAYKYQKQSKFLDESEHELTTINTEINSLRDNLKKYEENKISIQEQINTLTSKSKSKAEKQVMKFSKKEEELGKELVKLRSKHDNNEKELKRSNEKVVELKEKKVSVESLICRLKQEISESTVKFEEMEKELELVRADHKLQQENLQAANSGLQVSKSGDTKKALTLTEALTRASSAAEVLKSSDKQSQMRLKHARAELKTVVNKIKSMGNQDDKLMQKLDSARETVKSLEDSISKLTEGKIKGGVGEVTDLPERLGKNLDRLRNDRNQLENSLARTRDDHGRLSAKLSNLHFSFDRKRVKFDPREVKGRLVDLLTVKDPSYTLALESVAGGKLFNVVVTNDHVGKELIKNGGLKQRHTIIPLNKIRYREFDSRKLQIAKEIASKNKGNVDLAVNYINFDREITPAMLHVFGSTLICDSMSLARKIAFDKRIRTKTVTLEGDSVDPSGVLSGGSRRNGASVLASLDQLATLKARLSTEENRLQDIAEEVKAVSELSRNVGSILKKLNASQKELQMVQSKLQASEMGQILSSRVDLENKIQHLEKVREEDANKLKVETETVNKLKEQMKDAEASQKKVVQEAENKLKAAKKTLNATEKKFAKYRNTFEENKQELTRQEEEFSNLDDEILAVNDEIEQVSNDQLNTQSNLSLKEQEYSEAKEALEENRAEVKDLLMKTSSLNTQITNLEKSKQDDEIKLSKTESSLSRFKSDLKDSKKTLLALEKKYVWIKAERKLFGKPHTEYDFVRTDIEKAVSKLEKLREANGNLGRKVKKGVMERLERAEKEYNELNHKRLTIEKDRKAIEKVIADLDKKKNLTLFNTYKKVDTFFGSIFSTLLPGTEAKLIPYMEEKKTAKSKKAKKKQREEDSEDEDILYGSDDEEPSSKKHKSSGKGLSVAAEGQSIEENILTGLEVKVAFSKGQWKESLTELSGGQRSLLALSLILSFLRFKPAPMYILDEVDAALDLSHTQNIGLMLKKHFQQSQFIVVSLKEGMFNNANVIFRTKFVDGVSTVQRTLGSQKALTTDLDKENDPGNSKRRKKAKN